MSAILTPDQEKARKYFWHPLDDLETKEKVKERISLVGPYVNGFKIGMEAHTLFGNDILAWVKEEGYEIFLDLKFHDIPSTVEKAVCAVAAHDVYMCNVHALGGIKMMTFAHQGASRGSSLYGKRTPKVIGVTILTSMDIKTYFRTHRVDSEVYRDIIERYENETDNTMDDEYKMLQLERIAKLYGVADIIARKCATLAVDARKSGLEGVVCSGLDLERIRKEPLREDFMFVVPGIQNPDGTVGADQARVLTPGNAIRLGATHLVVGRALMGKHEDETREKCIRCLDDVVTVSN